MSPRGGSSESSLSDRPLQERPLTARTAGPRSLLAPSPCVLAALGAGRAVPGATASLRADSTEPLWVGAGLPDRTGEKLPASGQPGDAAAAAPTCQFKGQDSEVT